MKKRIISIILSLILIVGIVPLYSFAAFSADTNAVVIFEAPAKGTELPKGSFEAPEGLETYVREENGERFIVIDGNSVEKVAEKGISTKPTIKLDASLMQGKEYSGIKGFKGGTGDQLLKKWIVYHVKFNDSNPYEMLPASWSLSISGLKDYDIVTYGYSDIGENQMFWLDLEDGALRAAYPNSGTTSSNRVTGWEFFGDSEGYLCFPIILSTKRSKSQLADPSFYTDRYEGIKIQINTGTEPEGNYAHKSNSWEDRELLIGDIMMIDNLEKFQEDIIEDRNLIKFAPNNAEDTSYVAYRLPGYESSFQSWNGVASKIATNPFVAGEAGKYRTYIHRTSLPNGDQVYAVNLTEGQKSGNRVSANWSNVGTYESRTSGQENRTPVPGIPSKIDLTETEYLAIRLAIRAEKGATKEAKFTFEIAAHSKNKSKIAEGSYTFIDAKGNKSTLDVESDGSITVNKDIDGWLLVDTDAISLFADKNSTDSESGRPNSELYKTWGGDNSSGMCIYLNSGFDDGSRTAYVGDIYFVEDKDEFTKFHTTNCKAIGHKEVSVKEVPATCKKEGTTAGKKCSVCGKITEGCETIAKSTHDIKFVKKVEATATEMGYDLYKCSICGEEKKRNYVDATGQVVSGSSSTESKAENTSSKVDTNSGTTESNIANTSSEIAEEQDVVSSEIQSDSDPGLNSILIIVIVAAALVLAGLITTIVIVAGKKKKAVEGKTEQQELEQQQAEQQTDEE